MTYEDIEEGLFVEWDDWDDWDDWYEEYDWSEE